MPRLLILRTFAHTEIWEGREPCCHYERFARDGIIAWEPNLLDYTLDEIRYALGFYSESYFGNMNYSGRMSFAGSEGEEHPSLLELRPINRDSNFFAIDRRGKIQIAFGLLRKINNIPRQEMINIDRVFVNYKRREIGPQIPETRYSSLCFTLDERVVLNHINLQLDN